MHHISGNQFKSLYKHYEYDDGCAVIRVHACVHLPTCVLVVPNGALAPAYTIHTSNSAWDMSKRISTPVNQMRGRALPMMNIGAVLS